MGDGLTLHVDAALERATLVVAFEGWNDAGEAASSAARYLENAIRAVPLAEIDESEYLDLTVRRPWLRFADDGRRIVEWPATRFSFGSCDATRELVVAIGSEPHLRWRDYCEKFASLVARLRVRRVVLLGAYVADVVYSRPVGVSGIASDEKVLSDLDVIASQYEGPTGVIAVLGERLRADGVEVLSLWAALPHYISASPNPRGSLALLQKLAAGLSLVIDLEPLRRDAASFEHKISEIVAADPDLSEYVRQLKRREFAR